MQKRAGRNGRASLVATARGMHLLQRRTINFTVLTKPVRQLFLPLVVESSKSFHESIWKASLCRPQLQLLTDDFISARQAN
jgi:hypothetical protein